MKKIIAAITAIIATFALAAPAAAQPMWSDKDRFFVSYLRGESSEFYNVSAKTLITTAKKVCRALDKGLDETAAVYMMIDSGFTEDEAMTYISATMAAYCPRHGGDNIRTK